MKKTNKFTNRQTIIVTRLLNSLFSVNWFSSVKKYIAMFECIRGRNGLPYAIKYYKAVRLHITRYICDRPLRSNTSNVSIDSDGWPTRFNYLKVFLGGRPNNNVKALMTLLSWTRSVKPTSIESQKITVDYSSIDNPSKASKFYTIPSWFIKRWVLQNKLKSRKPSYSQHDHYTSSKSCPNGLATMSATWSFLSMPTNIYNYISSFLGDYAKDFWSLRDTLKLEHVSFVPKSKLENFGTLCIKDDPELKKRVVAMVDYGSQFVLRKIHNNLFRLLRKLPCDRTFTQNPFHNWSENSQNFHSLDLSSATDRYPVILQKKLIMYIYNDDHFANNWYKLLIDRDYIDPQGKPHRYCVGQPMGAYSSWAAFTLCHHLTVSWAAYLAGYDRFNDYIILGDDIVIKNNRVAQRYINIMTKLGVDISLQKTHVSPHTYEFAKRWISNGVEVSGINLRGIMQNIDNIYICYNSIQEYVLKVSILSKLSVVQIVSKIFHKIHYKIGNKIFISNSQSIMNQLKDFNVAMRYSRGLSTPTEIRSYLIRKIKGNFPSPPESVIPVFMQELFNKAIMSEVMKSHFSLVKQIHYFNVKIGRLFPNELAIPNLPVLLGYREHLSSVRKTLFKSRTGKMSLFQQLDLIKIKDIDLLIDMRKNPAKVLVMVNTLWKWMMKIISKPIDDNDPYSTLNDILGYDLELFLGPREDTDERWVDFLDKGLSTAQLLFELSNQDLTIPPSMILSDDQLTILILNCQDSVKLKPVKDYLIRHRQTLLRRPP